jgi:hypothetical protein
MVGQLFFEKVSKKGGEQYMINNVITNIAIIHDDDNGQYTYRSTRAIATLKNNTRLQLHAKPYCGAGGILSAEWVQKKISSFLQTDKKAFQDYCHGESQEHDPLTFMDWIDTQNYYYELFSSISKLKDRDVWEYHGNLREYSSAFRFFIFDKNLAAKCRRHIQARR